MQSNFIKRNKLFCKINNIENYDTDVKTLIIEWYVTLELSSLSYYY